MLEIPTEHQSTPNTFIMMPNLRKRTSRLAEALVKFFASGELGDKREIVDIVLLSVKNLQLSKNLETKFTKSHRLESCGLKLTLFTTCKTIRDFYHQNITSSTNTSQPAKLKMSKRNHTQVGMDFTDTIIVITQRGSIFTKTIG